MQSSFIRTVSLPSILAFPVGCWNRLEALFFDTDGDYLMMSGYIGRYSRICSWMFLVLCPPDREWWWYVSKCPQRADRAIDLPRAPKRPISMGTDAVSYWCKGSRFPVS